MVALNDSHARTLRTTLVLLFKEIAKKPGVDLSKANNGKLWEKECGEDLRESEKDDGTERSLSATVLFINLAADFETGCLNSPHASLITSFCLGEDTGVQPWNPIS